MGKIRFLVGDKVPSVINPNFLGQIVSILQQQSGIIYTVAHFKDDGSQAVISMLDFELEPAPITGTAGFKTKSRRET